MGVSVYRAKSPEDLFQHLISSGGTGIAFFTDEWFYSEKVDPPSMGRARDIFRAAMDVIGVKQAQNCVRSYKLNIQGVKNGAVISMVVFPVLISGNAK